MDRWLEEYFAELETVFGLGLFSMKRSGGLDSGEDSVQAYAAGSAAISSNRAQQIFLIINRLRQMLLSP